MANDDFYLQASETQWAALEGQKLEELAALHRAKATGDVDAAAASVQHIANIEAAKRDLLSLTNEYRNSISPPVPPSVSREQRAARRMDEMDAQDVLDLARGSRYAKNITWDDPAMRAGYAEVQRRRARGE